MPKNNRDLNRNAPDHADAALLIIDMINDLEFPGGEYIFDAALAAAKQIAALKARAMQCGIPVIFANDNFGRWRSNFQEAIEHCLSAGVRGTPLAGVLRPAAEDYFILKPKHSAFYATPLELLLNHLECKRLILTGISGHMCVQFTACDAYMRDFELYVPEDCMASHPEEQNRRALDYVKDVLGADTTRSECLDLWKLSGGQSISDGPLKKPL